MQNNQNGSEDIISEPEMMDIPQENISEENNIDSIEENEINIEENTEIPQENIKKPKRTYDKKYHELNQKIDILTNTLTNLLGRNVSDQTDIEGISDPIAPKFKYPKDSLAAQLFTIEKNRQEYTTELKNQQMKAEYEELMKKVEGEIEEAKHTIPGFLESFNIVNNATSGVNQIMGSEIFSSTMPIRLIQYLGKNPKEMNRIKGMPLHQQRREMITLENSLKTNPKLTSKTPPPVGQLMPQRNTGSSVENMSIADRVAQLRREKRK